MNSTNSESIRLLRDVDAYMVPSGDEVKLLAGNLVRITQALGGNYTVIMNGNMVQIRSENADALGIQIEKELEAKPSGDIEKQIWDQLKTCYDPEIPVDIVELGLIYDLSIENGNSGKRVSIKMTLTAPGCPVAGEMPGWVVDAIEPIAGIKKVDVELIWEPPWGMDMMSDEAKLELGFI